VGFFFFNFITQPIQVVDATFKNTWSSLRNSRDCIMLLV